MCINYGALEQKDHSWLKIELYCHKHNGKSLKKHPPTLQKSDIVELTLRIKNFRLEIISFVSIEQNVNAKVFVPNVNAPAFVPSFATPAAQVPPPQVPVAQVPPAPDLVAQVPQVSVAPVPQVSIASVPTEASVPQVAQVPAAEPVQPPEQESSSPLKQEPESSAPPPGNHSHLIPKSSCPRE